MDSQSNQRFRQTGGVMKQFSALTEDHEIACVARLRWWTHNGGAMALAAQAHLTSMNVPVEAANPRSYEDLASGGQGGDGGQKMTGGDGDAQAPGRDGTGAAGGGTGAAGGRGGSEAKSLSRSSGTAGRKGEKKRIDVDSQYTCQDNIYTCIHCADKQFQCRNITRMAAHIQQCTDCPDDVKATCARSSQNHTKKLKMTVATGIDGTTAGSTTQAPRAPSSGEFDVPLATRGRAAHYCRVGRRGRPSALVARERRTWVTTFHWESLVVLPFRRSTRGPLGAIGWLLVPPLGLGELKFPSAPLHFHVKFPKFPSELVWTEIYFH